MDLRRVISSELGNVPDQHREILGGISAYTMPSNPHQSKLTERGDAHDQPLFAAFFGRGGPSTAGSDFRYSAIAARSSGVSCEVFLITRAIAPPAESPSGICPVSRK